MGRGRPAASKRRTARPRVQHDRADLANVGAHLAVARLVAIALGALVRRRAGGQHRRRRGQHRERRGHRRLRGRRHGSGAHRTRQQQRRKVCVSQFLRSMPRSKRTIERRRVVPFVLSVAHQRPARAVPILRPLPSAKSRHTRLWPCVRSPEFTRGRRSRTRRLHKLVWSPSMEEQRSLAPPGSRIAGRPGQAAVAAPSVAKRSSAPRPNAQISGRARCHG